MKANKPIKPVLGDNNRDRAYKVLFDIVSLFDKYNIIYHLEGGTLLGIVRDKKLIPWDYDVDISVPESEAEKLNKIRLPLLKLGYKVAKYKFKKDFGPCNSGNIRMIKVKKIIFSILKEIIPSFRKNYIILDVFIKFEDEKFCYWQAKEKIMRVDKKYYKSYEEIDFRGRKLKVPNDYKNYLTEKYGDWHTPIKEWDCKYDEKTICGSVAVTQ